MTQYGSSSDRPRGRRARPESNDWAGYDAPAGDREFPDLQPIRPTGARTADTREARGQYRGRHTEGQPSLGQDGGQYDAGQYDGGQYEEAQHGGGQYGGGQYGPGQYGGQQRGGQPGVSQAPWDAVPQAPAQPQFQPAPGQQPSLQQPSSRPPAQQAPVERPPVERPPVRRGGPRHGAQRPAHPAGWEDPDEDDPMAAFSKRWRQRGEETPEDAGKRKRLYMIGGGVVVVIIAVLVYFFGFGGGGAANTSLGDLVTTFLPGELQQVPNACTSVSASTLSQTLPGPARMASPPDNSGLQSQCTWTLDHQPTYRVLQVNITAYSPSSLASGDGSATFAADDAFTQAESGKKNPSAKSGQPKAVVAVVPGVGSSAFSAFQVFDKGGATMDMATVYVQYHNVVVQVVLNGLDKGNSGTNYGPVSQSQLQSQARSVAQQVAAKVSA